MITGRSVHNQRIERLWRDVNMKVVRYFKNIFIAMQDEEILDPLDEVDVYDCILFFYLESIGLLQNLYFSITIIR